MPCFGKGKKNNNKIDTKGGPEENDGIKTLSPPPKKIASKASVKNLGKMFKELECPVCYNTCVAPIETCKNGHIICSNCRACMNVCPTCRERFTGTRNFFAENFINQYSQPCKFKLSGCEYIRWKGENMAPHENTCQFRHLSCIVPSSCSKSLPYRSLLDHLIDEHKVAGCERLPASVTYDVLDPIVSTRKWLPYYIKQFGNIFFVMMEVIRPNFHIWVWVQELKKESHNIDSMYIATIRFESSDKSLVNSWEGPVHSIRTQASTIKKEGLCFVVPESVMQHFERESRITFLLNIEKRKLVVVANAKEKQSLEESDVALPAKPFTGGPQLDETIPDEIFHTSPENPGYLTYPSLSMLSTENGNMLDINNNMESGPIHSPR